MSIWIILMVSICLAFKKGHITNEMISNEVSYKLGIILLCLIPFIIKIKCLFSTEEHTKKLIHSIGFYIDGIILDNQKIKWNDINRISLVFQDYQGEIFKWILWNFENLRSSGCDNPIYIKLNNGIEIEGNVQIDSNKTISILDELFILAIKKNNLDNQKYLFVCNKTIANNV